MSNGSDYFKESATNQQKKAAALHSSEFLFLLATMRELVLNVGVFVLAVRGLVLSI